MNVLVEDLVQRLSRNDPSLHRLAVSRLPLWKVTAKETRALVKSLEHNTHVEHLDFWLPQEEQEEEDESEGSDAYDFSAVADNTSDNDLSAPSLPDLDATYLETVFANNRSLQSLQVGCGSMSSPVKSDAWRFFVAGLQQNNSLQKLELDGSCSSGGHGNPAGLDTTACRELANYLATTTHLKELVLASIQTKTSQGLALLVQGLAINSSLESVEILQMEFPEVMSDDDDKDKWEESWALLLESLGQISSLHSLHLIDCDIPCDSTSGRLAVQTLCQSKSLQCLRWIESDLSASTISALSDGLQHNTSFRVLDLRGNGLSAEHCKPLGDLLRHCSLDKLILEENLIGDEGLDHLATGLVKLRKVNLRCNLITSSGCKLLADALNMDEASLQTLDVSENAISDDGAEALGSVIKRSSLLELAIESCLVTDDGVAGLIHSLCDSKALLQSLSLAQNHISETGASALVKMLASNESLSSLDLSSCHLSDKSIEVLAQGLTSDKNRTLKRLSLAFNEFGNGGAESLGHLLPRCRLERLESQFNNFDDKGLAAIVQGLSNSYWLKDLFVLSSSTYCSMSGKLVDEMSHWLSLNRAGRRVVLDDSIPLSVWPRLLERADQVAGPESLFHMLRNRPDLVSSTSYGCSPRALNTEGIK
jgi:Ran GTPase-activating protein (RanGAP) involved in mRNA processing and transport